MHPKPDGCIIGIDDAYRALFGEPCPHCGIEDEVIGVLGVGLDDANVTSNQALPEVGIAGLSGLVLDQFDQDDAVHS